MKKNKQIDINSMSDKQFLKASETIKSEVKKTVEETVQNLNKYLNIYGLEILLGVQIVKQGEANLIKEEVTQKLSQESTIQE